MRTVHFDPSSGAAGDMVVGALLDAGASLEAVREAVLSTGLGGVSVSAEKGKRGGLAGTRFTVKAEGDQPHRRLGDILKMIAASNLNERARGRAEAVFRLLAEAEGRVHGAPPEEVHFHEVGAADSIADVVGAAAALEDLNVETVTSGPPALGHDAVIDSSHGKLPVPPPAVLEILRGREIKPGLPGVEMTTPTGAALLVALTGDFGALPEMELAATGCGLGGREDQRQPNLLRALLGQRTASDGERVVEVTVTLDDLPGEVMGYLFERLPEEGALEVSLMPCTLKKNRPGVRLSVLAPADRLDAVARAVFRETSTLGLRFSPVRFSGPMRSSRAP